MIMAWNAPAAIRTFLFCSSLIETDAYSVANALGSYRTTYPSMHIFSDRTKSSMIVSSATW